MDDNNEFVDAYRSPSELYKFLESRYIESPYFLGRNLSFRLQHKKARIEKHPSSYRKLSTIFPKSVRQKKLNRVPSHLHISLQALKVHQQDYGAIFAVFQSKGNRDYQMLDTFSDRMIFGREEYPFHSVLLRGGGDVVVVCQLYDLPLLPDVEHLANEIRMKAFCNDELVSFNENYTPYEPLLFGRLTLSVKCSKRGTFDISCRKAKSNPLIVTSCISWSYGSEKLESKPIMTEISSRKGIVFASPTVLIHYQFHSDLKCKTEKLEKMICPWCHLDALTPEGLVCHITSTHTSFCYSILVDIDGVIHVNASLLGLRIQDHPTFCSDFTHVKPRRQLPLSGTVGGYHATPPSTPMAAIKVNGGRNVYPRQYFHSRTGTIILEDEMEYDSDNDVDEEWLLRQSDDLLDEFEDVSLEEKELMKRWNRFSHSYRIMSDANVLGACAEFAEKNRYWIHERGLRQNFLFHLFNLWDYSLLGSQDLVDCIRVLDVKQTLKIGIKAY